MTEASDHHKQPQRLPHKKGKRTISEAEVIRYIKNKTLEGFRKNPKNSHINDYWLFLTVHDRTFCGVDELKMSQPIISNYERTYMRFNACDAT